MDTARLDNRSATAEDKINDLLAKMTLEEKVSLCHASSKFAVAGIERLGIPDFEMSDGPHGVRQEISRDSWEPAGWDNDFATYLPTGTAQAATWNPEMMNLAGKVLGAESRKRGKDVILGPGFNIIRTPLCGRNFEYYGEDPYQVAKLAVAAVKGIQSQDVAACLKHYAANNQELNRCHTDVEMAERTLREIYLPAFKAAVQDGKALTIMGAYNKFRGQHCCHNDYLVNKVLKEEWGFEGAYITDWDGAWSTEEAVNNGLDIEMGTHKERYEDYHLANPYLEGLKSGKYDEATLNDKVKRILRVMVLIGMFDDDRLPGQLNGETHQKAALRVAEEAIVLLKNERQLLPLDNNKIKTIAVIGDNANKLHATGGNSSAVKPLYEITPLAGLQQKFGDTVEIKFAQGYPENTSGLIDINTELLSTVDQGSGVKGWNAEYFSNRGLEGEPTAVRYEESVGYDAQADNLPEGVNDVLLSIRWTGELSPVETGEYKLGVYVDGTSRIFLDGEMLLETREGLALETVKKAVQLEAGKKYQLRVEYEKSNNSNLFEFGWQPCGMADESGKSRFDEAIEAAKSADAVLFFGGLNHFFDVEGCDRPDMKLPYDQDQLIQAIAAVNDNTVVCMVGGSPVEMPWIDQVPAVIQMWYAGMEGGNAIANILFGDVNPSGKLPFTFPKQLSDCPAHKIGTYREELSTYDEGIMVGYRYYDTENIETLFPFGHGLSYTSFEYSNLKTEQLSNGEINVSVDITNTGEMAGAEVVQLYVQDVECSVERPRKELKGFQKVLLDVNETKSVEMTLTQQDLAFYDETSSGWKVEPGEFNLFIGSSCSDIRLKDSFTI